MTDYCTIKTRNKWLTRVSAAFICLLFATTATALSNEAINEKQRAYNAELGKYNQTNDKLTRLQVSIATAKSTLHDKGKQKKESANTLEDIQHLDRKNPSLGLDTKVQEARRHNRSAFEQHRDAEDNLRSLQRKAATLNENLNDSILVLNSLAREIKRTTNKVIASELTKRLAKFSTTTTVEGHAEVGCGEESLRKCQNRALRSAQRDATEKGSVVIVQAITQIDNFQLTKDQVKTNVQARLSNVEVIKKGWAGDASYQYHIRAQVTPVIGELLTTQIKDAIIRDYGIVIPAILTNNLKPSVITVASSSPSNQSFSSRTTAEKSFDEMDQDTGHRKTNAEHDLERQKPQRKPKEVIHIHKESPSFRTESWYTLWGMGRSSGLTIDGTDIYDGVDYEERTSNALSLLGIYFPVSRSTIIGGIYTIANDEITFINGTTLSNTQKRISLSMLQFLGKGIGHGLYYRMDVGSASATFKLRNSTILVDKDIVRNNGLGLLFGLGYGIALGNDFRILLSFTYATDTIDEFEIETTSFNISGLW